jgi:transcription initiation factor TFIIB
MATRDIYERGFDDTSGKTLDETATCPECNGGFAPDAGEIACAECGLIVVEQRIDHGLEWCQYDEQERKRPGTPLTEGYHDRGMSTEIGRGGDLNGNTLSARKRRRLTRMRRERTQGRWRSKAERNLAHGSARCAGWRVLSSSPSRFVTRRVSSSGVLRTRICFVADPSRRSPQPASTGPAGQRAATNARRHHPSRAPRAVAGDEPYMTLNTELDLPAQPVTPSAFVPRLTSELDVSDQIQQRARPLAEASESTGATTGVRPSGFAAALQSRARTRAVAHPVGHR